MHVATALLAEQVACCTYTHQRRGFKHGTNGEEERKAISAEPPASTRAHQEPSYLASKPVIRLENSIWELCSHAMSDPAAKHHARSSG